MNTLLPPSLTPEEMYENLVADGGRTVMHGGDPYEDDLEPATPAENETGAA